MLFLLSFQLAAKKAPKWKPGVFKTTQEGIRYSIKKVGTGKEIKTGDVVRFFLFAYNGHTKKYDAVLNPPPNASDSKTGGVISLDENTSENGIVKAIKLLKKGGEGYFIIPGTLIGHADSSCYFIRIVDVSAQVTIFNPPADSVKADSVKIKVTDPGQKYYGDTLFSFMKLVEVPQMTDCGISAVVVAFKFELTWFDNGTQRKNIIVFIECPELYGKDYFVKGASYIVTAIPMTENYKSGHRTMNSYSLEKLESYYCLRVKKMGS